MTEEQLNKHIFYKLGKSRQDNLINMLKKQEGNNFSNGLENGMCYLLTLGWIDYILTQMIISKQANQLIPKCLTIDSLNKICQLNGYLQRLAILQKKYLKKEYQYWTDKICHCFDDATQLSLECTRILAELNPEYLKIVEKLVGNTCLSQPYSDHDLSVKKELNIPFISNREALVLFFCHRSNQDGVYHKHVIGIVRSIYPLKVKNKDGSVIYKDSEGYIAYDSNKGLYFFKKLIDVFSLLYTYCQTSNERKNINFSLISIDYLGK